MADIRGYEDAATVAGKGYLYNFSQCKTESEVPCPVCGKSMYVNTRKGTHNCFHCGFGGSAIDFYAALVGIDEGSVKETRIAAGRDFNKRCGSEEAPKRPPKAAPMPEQKQYDIASAETRNATYKAFLESLRLEDAHRDDLLRRGLDEETIRLNGYKSAPLIGIENLCLDLLEKGCTLEGVPGFYRENGHWRFVKHGAGYYIPSRSIDGKIQALQLRTQTAPDEQDRKMTRYYTISSSSYENGTKGRTFPHFNPGKGRGDCLVLTEGPLKADVISHLKGVETLAVMGVNCLDQLPAMLPVFRQMGYHIVKIAYDMDMYSNPNVLRAYGTLKMLITRAGLSTMTLEWDTSYKGLDDYLLYKSQQM